MINWLLEQCPCDGLACDSVHSVANKSLKVCLAGRHYHLICITCRENFIKTPSHAGLWCARSIYFASLGSCGSAASGTAALLHRDWLWDWGRLMTWTDDVLSYHLVPKMPRCWCQHFPKLTRFVVSCFWQLKLPGRSEKSPEQAPKSASWQH